MFRNPLTGVYPSKNPIWYCKSLLGIINTWTSFDHPVSPDVTGAAGCQLNVERWHANANALQSGHLERLAERAEISGAKMGKMEPQWSHTATTRHYKTNPCSEACHLTHLEVESGVQCHFLARWSGIFRLLARSFTYFYSRYKTLPYGSDWSIWDPYCGHSPCRAGGTRPGLSPDSNRCGNNTTRPGQVFGLTACGS